MSRQPVSLLLSQLWNLSTKLPQQLQQRLLLCVTVGWHQKMHPPCSQNPTSKVQQSHGHRERWFGQQSHVFGGCWYNRKTSSPCSHTDWDCSKGSNRNTVVLGNTGPYPPPFGKGFTVAPPMRKHTWMLSVSNTCCSASPIRSPHCQQLFVLAFSIQQWPACFRPQRLNVTRSLTTEQLFHLPH